MKLNPETFGNRLRHFGFTEQVIDEIANCIEIKNELVDFKKEHHLPKWTQEDKDRKYES